MSTFSILVLSGVGAGLRQTDSLSEESHVSSIIGLKCPCHVKSWVTLSCSAVEKDFV